MVDSHISKQQVQTYISWNSNMYGHVNNLLLSPAAITRLLVLGRTLHIPEVQSSYKLLRKSVQA